MKRLCGVFMVLALLIGALAGCNIDNIRDSVNEDIDTLVDKVDGDDE